MKVFLTILMFISLQASAATYYFSTTDGLDSRNSTQAQSSATPWQTVSKYNTIASSLVPGDSILWKRGDTFSGVLSPPANGSNGNPIVFTSYGTGAKPIISGFFTLTSWAQVGSTNVWQASLFAGTSLEVVMNGNQFRAMGRTPNAAPYLNIDAYDNCTVDFFNGSPCAINCTGAPAGSQSFVGGQIYIGLNPYNYDRNEITTHSGNKLTYITSNNNNATGNDHGVNNKFFIQNHFSTLDQVGEWYYNRSTNVLNYYSSGNPGSLVVGANDYGMYYAGSSGNNKHDLTIRNIHFTGQDSIGLRFFYADRIVVDYCDFDYIGTNAIEAGYDFGSTANCTDVKVTNCTVNVIGNNGIHMRHCSKVDVEYNNVDSTGYLLGMGSSNNLQRIGIMIYDGIDSVKIKYNQVSNTGNSGIVFSGVEKSSSVFGNSVSNFGSTTSDGGGIYTCCGVTSTTNRIVDSNVVLNGYGRRQLMSDSTTGGMPAIYLDDNSNKVDITNNFVYNGTRADIFLHNANNINVTGNTVYAGKGEPAMGLEDDALGGAIRSVNVYNNKIYTLPGVNAVFLRSDANDYGSMGTFANNYYSRSSTGNLFNTTGNVTTSYSLSSWKSTFGYDQGTIFTQVIDDSVRVEYNNSAVSKYVLLPNTYTNLTGVAGYFGYVRVPPYSSLLLYRRTFATLKTARPIKVIP